VSTELHVGYSPKYQDWQLGRGHPTNPVRAELACGLLEELMPGLVYHDPDEYLDSDLVTALCTVHDPDYVARVVIDCDFNGEADAGSPKLAAAALAMFGGTYALVQEMLQAEKPAVYFNPQGAKHHAMWNRAAGFCAFNDMAWAALHLAGQGLRVGYLDWDAHAGDGVQYLTQHADAVTTFSIHQEGIFPGQPWTYTDAVASGVYNRPLPAGSGDAALLTHVKEARAWFREKEVDVVLLAAGADGLAEDPLTGLNYTIPGMYKAAQEIGRSCALRGVPILVGGAGGYTPLKETPITWAGVVMTLLKEYDQVEATIGEGARRTRLTEAMAKAGLEA
jgi:acetoin utilization protein AcuC